MNIYVWRLVLGISSDVAFGRSSCKDSYTRCAQQANGLRKDNQRSIRKRKKSSSCYPDEYEERIMTQPPSHIHVCVAKIESKKTIPAFSEQGRLFFKKRKRKRDSEKRKKKNMFLSEKRRNEDAKRLRKRKIMKHPANFTHPSSYSNEFCSEQKTIARGEKTKRAVDCATSSVSQLPKRLNP